MDKKYPKDCSRCCGVRGIKPCCSEGLLCVCVRAGGGGFRSPGGDGGFRGGGRGMPRGRGGRGAGGRGGFRGGRKVTVEPHRHEGECVIMMISTVCVSVCVISDDVLTVFRSVYLPWEGRCPGNEEHGGGRVGVRGEENQCGGQTPASTPSIDISHTS